MKAHLHRVLFLCLVPSLLSSSSLTVGSSKSTWACVGGPPNYCPRQDTAVQTLNTLSLTLGPTGNTGAYFVDADLGSRIVRVTDNNTENPSVGCCVNNSSAESQEWGIYDPTLFSGDGGHRFYTLDDGAGYQLWAIDAKTMSICRFTYGPGGCNGSTGNPNGLNSSSRISAWTPSAWSQNQPTVLYGYEGRGVGKNNLFVKYDTTLDKFYSTTGTAGSSLTYFLDFSTCPNQPGISGSYGTSYASRADRYLSAVVGGATQGQSTLAFWWDTTAGNCYWYDTYHGTYGGTGLTTSTTSFGQLPVPGAPTLSASAGGTVNYCLKVTGVSNVNSQTTTNVIGETLPSAEVTTTGSSSATLTITFAEPFADPYENAIYGCVTGVWSDVSPCKPYRIYMSANAAGSCSGTEVLQTSFGTSASGYVTGVSSDSSPSVTISATSIVTGTATPPTAQSAGYNIHQGQSNWSGSLVNIKQALYGGTFGTPPSGFVFCPNTIAGPSNASCSTGHSVGGNLDFINNSGLIGTTYNVLSTAVRAYNSPSSPANLLSSSQLPSGTPNTDMHYSWNDAGPFDRMPIGNVFVGTGVGNGSTNLNSNPCTSNQGVGWGNEVVALATDGSARVWRFAHHRGGACLNPNTNDSNGAFSNSWPIGNISQDGKFYLFSSTFGWGLGNDVSGLQNNAAYPASTWQASHTYASGAYIFDGTNFEINNGSSGVSGATQPSPWPSTSGQTTIDGGVTWTMFTGCTDPNNPGTALPCRYDVFVVELK
jgi:hypothetical protein